MKLAMAKIREEKGVALVIALIVSVAIMAMVTGMLYVINQSTRMSGAGKTYATAAEAADGAVNVMKDAINLVLWGEALPGVIAAGTCDENSDPTTGTLSYAILNENVVCSKDLVLPAAFSSNFNATVTLQRLYTISLPGSRLEFARSASGVSGAAIFFRINTIVTGPNGARAENSILYRFAG